MAAAAQETKADTRAMEEDERWMAPGLRGLLRNSVDGPSLGRPDSPGPENVQPAGVIGAFGKSILKRIEEFQKERVEICPPRWLAPFVFSPTNPASVAELETTSLLLDSGASVHAIGEARLLRSIELFSIDKWAVLPDGTRLRIVGTGTMHTDRFSIPKVHLVDGLKKNLISVSQLDKDHGLCCCFHSKICEVILADGTVVGGAILLDDGMYELRFLEVPREPEA